MKVLWFSNSPCGSIRRYNKNIYCGGWMISLEDIIKKNNNIQLEVSFFTNKNEQPFVFNKVKYYPISLQISSNPILRVLERMQPMHRIDYEMLPKMLAIVKESNPDIIHIHGTEERFGIIQEYVKDIPIVFSIQGLIAPYKDKFFSGVSQINAYKLDSIIDKIKNVSIKDQYKSFCYRSEREKNYLSHAKYIFGRTFWDENITYALNPQRKYYIVNEIMRPEFYKRKWDKIHFDFKLQLVSTISGGIYKGYETLLKTAKLLKDYSHIDFQWHVAGYNSNSKWVRIAEKVTGIKSTDVNVTFHGCIDADVLSNLLIASDIYCHVSHIENSPNSVCEAMLVGMPIIASFTGGTASILKDGEEGLLYQDGDSYVLAGCVLKYYENFDLAFKYAVNGNKKALIRYSPINVANELISGYTNILKDFY